MAGCFGNPDPQPAEPSPTEPGPLTQEKATQLADAAVAELASALNGTDGSDLAAIRATFHITGGSDATEAADAPAGSGGPYGSGTAGPDPTQELFGGPIDLDLWLQWGQGDVAKAIMDMSFGGLRFSLETWCTPEQDLLVWGGQTYASRPSGQRGSCLPGAFMGDDFQGNPLEGLDPEHLDRLDVTINANGTITAVYQDDDGTFTMLLDAQGQPLALDFDGDEATGSMRFDYGPRPALKPPAPTSRLAAPNQAFEFDGENYTVFGPSQAPLGEITVRVLDDAGAILASFDPANPVRQTQAGYMFQYADDGDGRLGQNDTFRLTGPERYPNVQLWDEWAERYTGDNPIPAGSLALAALALIAAGVAYRRR